MIVSFPNAELRDAVGEVSGVEAVLWDGVADPDPRIEMCVPDYRDLRTMHRLGELPALRVVQTQLAGFDGQLELLPDGVTLCNAAGVHDDATAEHAVGLLLAVWRRIPEAVRGHGTWQQLRPGMRSLADSRVMVLGYGSIGRALTHRLLAHGARVTAVATRAREDDLVGPVHPVEELPGLLPTMHAVVVLLPLSERTQGFVGADFLAALPDGALVVNVARGGVVDTDAVIAEAGRLSFALDVTDPEPLPDGHPLWDAPDVLVTPHVAGGTTAMLPRMSALVREQLGRYLAGHPLRNVVAGPDRG
ncbi:2-hydroxyacid dehydrogenase [Nocardioides euryhalodurans]|uniref:Hydroxyacid dehydrogenase n=1 Tax=Nocardioides euryhalodurans TaxID=2518370 RepID=A0A4P7GMV6_9ACTN|nr:2-hydroxyacid dehydrogenase [Nocardioides euryhalodurans]QBR93259.1 hydroxyacid dehydrogenase [Nocardioides euryhalodurans]